METLSMTTMKRLAIRDLRYIQLSLRQIEREQQGNERMSPDLLQSFVTSLNDAAFRVQSICVSLVSSAGAVAKLPEEVQKAVVQTLAIRRRVRQFLIQRLAIILSGGKNLPETRRQAFAEATSRTNMLGTLLDGALHARKIARAH